jgi:alpha-tubulin suppressor-like RCC1 family protein
LNSSGQLGNGTLLNKSNPTLVHGLSGILAIDAGVYHSIALESDGTVWTFGENSSGQLGNGVKTDASTPVSVTGLDLIAP